MKARAAAVLAGPVLVAYLMSGCGGEAEDSKTESVSSNSVPVVVSISPGEGTTLGGTRVVISGSNFDRAAAVTVGGVQASSTVVVGSTGLWVTMPPHTTGTVDVVVANPDGRSGTLAGGFTYNQPDAPEPPIFTDVAAEAGVDFLHHEATEDLMTIAAGVIVLDFDGDGLDDIYVPDSQGPNVLYRNHGDGTFTDVAVLAGVADASGKGNGGCAADYDNDGDQDLFVTNYGPSRLFRNNGDGTFADATAAARVGDTQTAFRSTGYAWGDYDRDGYVDLIVVRHLYEHSLNMVKAKDFVPGVGGLVLHHNQGDGTFVDATGLLGDTTDPVALDSGEPVGNLWGAGFQPGWTDFDNDGDLDLYVVNDFGADLRPNVLWRNDGSGQNGSWTFSDISRDSGTGVPIYGMGLAVGDYDLDGDLDFFMINIGHNVLLMNEGNGLAFTDTTTDARVGTGIIGRKLRISWGAVFFDYDNDGDEDLYVVSGFLKGPPPPANPREQPNVLLRNNGDGTFADVSSESGADDPGVGRGGAYLDFDGDGCLDLFVANLGQRARLFRNGCSTDNGWLAVRTVGTNSNRDGVGARIEVDAGGSTMIREITAGSSQMGQSMMAAHFGLSGARKVDRLTIRWPGGQTQTLTNVEANRRITVTEPY